MPILNARDYRLAKAKLARVKRALGASMSIDQLATNISDDAAAARKAALEMERANIEDDLGHYERLQSTENLTREDFEVTELGFLPIVARIRKRLSQKQLAEVLGLKEQQIQRYERERYATISLKRLEEIFAVMGVDLRAHVDSAPLEDRPQPEPVTDLSLELSKATIREIKKRKWLGNEKIADETIFEYLKSGQALISRDPHYRRSLLQDRAYDAAGMTAWQARVALEARRRQSTVKAKFDFADMGWLQALVKLSVHEDGPLKAVDFLATKGIVLVIEPHLPNTYLDGAAFLLSDRTPVIGLTLRYDRIDYFWFTLLHELAHIFLHYRKGLEIGFFDDFDLGDKSELEKEADGFARSALMPEKLWNASPARFSTVAEPLLNFAKNCGIHPAIVAGRIQRERSDFRLFRQLLGQGKVKSLFS